MAKVRMIVCELCGEYRAESEVGPHLIRYGTRKCPGEKAPTRPSAPRQKGSVQASRIEKPRKVNRKIAKAYDDTSKSSVHAIYIGKHKQ